MRASGKDRRTFLMPAPLLPAGSCTWGSRLFFPPGAAFVFAASGKKLMSFWVRLRLWPTARCLGQGTAVLVFHKRQSAGDQFPSGKR